MSKNKKSVYSFVTFLIIFNTVFVFNAYASDNGNKKILPVMVGGEEEFDACSSQAFIGGAKSGKISVMGIPGREEIDRLNNGRLVIMCDDTEINGEPWTGIVYPAGGSDIGKCNLSSPIPIKKAYTGPCRSGWVRTKWLKDIIG